MKKLSFGKEGSITNETVMNNNTMMNNISIPKTVKESCVFGFKKKKLKSSSNANFNAS
jgi:hypothetical protein